MLNSPKSFFTPLTMRSDKYPSTWGAYPQRLVKKGEKEALEYSTKHPIVLDAGLRHHIICKQADFYIDSSKHKGYV